ncbi:putative adhesion G protein-coupled receptor E4P [Phaenicophaeus curvirostris]|uniref:putative adhesion G protein-coupled receptor E4P n=1 Tax=Phaenicophaeus curvirostris TaxID=33595 RepID=UPI0037F0C67C
MGCPPPTAFFWGLCHLLSLLPHNDQTMPCSPQSPQSCSLRSCCLGWTKGRPPTNSTTGYPGFSPKPESTCKIPTLEEARRACGDPKIPPGASNCIRQLLDACTQPTQENLQTVLEQLQNVVLEDPNPTRTELLLQSTEALVLQVALSGPASGPQNFNTTIMEATVEVVHNNCPQPVLVLAVGEQNLTISCQEVVSNAQAGKQAVAFIVYKEVEKVLSDAAELGRLNSRVVGGTVGKPGVTFNIPFNISLQHLTALPAGEESRCVSWQTEGRWTPLGCTRIGGDTFHSICACTHFSTFAILTAIHPVTESFALTVVTYVGLSVSLVCLFLAIITFLLCRSLWSVSVTLHLQLSICLFAADLLFLVAVTHTTNQLVCAITAAFLHYLFLACFAWMFLEGLHLFLTIRNLRVLNYTNASRFRKRYIYPVGYGIPAIVVAVSAAIHPHGYGTERYCWLSMERHFIWSFLGPVCVIILVNLLFFLTTLWILRIKLSSLNADVTALKNTRLMTFKALAHICILGCTWGLGFLQVQGDNIVVAFIFTIVNSLQGAFIFLVHCVLNRQVMEQYRRWVRALGHQEQPRELPTTEINISCVTEGERPQSHSTQGCTWEK